MNQIYIESDVLEYLQKHCRGYGKRQNLKVIGLFIDCEERQVYDAINTLNLSGEPVFVLGDECFYLGKENKNLEDLTALKELNKQNNLIHEYKRNTIFAVLKNLNMNVDLGE